MIAGRAAYDSAAGRGRRLRAPRDAGVAASVVHWARDGGGCVHVCTREKRHASYDAGDGTNPEQLFAAGFAACFHGASTLVAMRRRIRLPTDLAIAATATFQRDPADGLFAIALDVAVGMPGVDADAARERVAETEAICPYAKMARRGIRHVVRVTGTV